MKFVLFLEGETERKVLPGFLKCWLDPQLAQRVGIVPVKFDGCSHFRREVRRKALLYLNDPNATEIIAVVGLLDLYGFGKDEHGGYPLYPQGIQTAPQRRRWAINDIQSEIAHPQFRMFFAVHELEAWLLAQPTIFSSQLRSEI